MSKIEPPFVLFRNELEEETVYFDQPEAVIVAGEADQWEAALAQAEKARRDGFWLAGYLSYEAGYLLEPKLVPLLPAVRRAPLLCLGVFKAPSRHFAGANLFDEGGRLFASRPVWSLEAYSERFARLHDHIRRGDCYQANLTFPVNARWEGSAGGLFEALRKRQPVRHSAMVALGQPVILSRSPELFFEVSAEGMIESLPMKGTMPRGQTRQEDEALKAFLRSDLKNQAENRMIVDLLRNDISRISKVGTLDVPELFAVQTYETVHQMVSSVRAQLDGDPDLRTIFKALFPCGSITGAPKIRAMEILRQLETEARNAYCGSIGWVAPDGRMRFNVAIRTISLFDHGEAMYNVGGGIVFDSKAEDEYAECLIKARFAESFPSFG